MKNRILDNIQTENTWLDVETVAKLKGISKRGVRLAINNYEHKQKHFFEIKQKIDKYRSLPEPKKKVRCVETGEIFESAREASKWVEFVREIDYCHHDYIKLVCKGKHKTCFGYHWEFVNS